MTNSSKDVLEQNVGTLIETGGEAPKLADAARTRIRAELVTKFGTAAPQRTRARTPLVAVGFGLAATAAAALVATRFAGHDAAPITDGASTTLADGSTYITAPGAKVSVLGPRRVRVEGAALLDVASGKGTFVVETQRGRIEVLGTRFMVDGQAERTTTAVVRGEVKLATSSGDVVLHAGEQGVAEPGRPPVRGPAPRLSHLVSWAEHARHTDEHAVEPLHHGTLFARDPGVRSHPPWGQEYPLPIKQLGLDIVVEDQVARVAIDQTFHNDAAQDLEGVYRFAIPPDAALQRLAMYVDGKLTESAVVERMQARRIYEELVYRRVDPALLEWAGSGRLSLRVYPIPALQDKRLMVAYTQSLPKLYDDWTLTVPLPEVDQPVGTMDIAVRVKGCANCELMSTSHTIDVERTGDDAIVHYHHGSEKVGDSFVLHVRDTRHQTTVATAADGADRYVMVRAPVKIADSAPAYRPRTWVILDDVSASRAPAELHAQQDLVDAFVRELDEDDKLAVVAFDVEARQKLAPTRVIDIDRKALRASLAHEGGVGATDFGIALDAATRLLAGANPDDAMIVYLGDGMITSGARNLDALRAQIAGKAHFIGVGLGDGPDIQTLGGLAAATGGYSTTMDLADDLGWRAFDLVAALHTSRVTGLEAKLVDDAGNLVPATAYVGSQQLADGEELELVAKLAGGATPAGVELSGIVAGAPWHTRVALAAKPHDAAGYLPRLWAQHHIAARLLAKHEPVAIPPCDAGCPTEAELREARDEQIRREVVGLGKRYFLLSRHTSLLVLENDDMYKQYGVVKGSGETWAPYAMPAKIPVTITAAPTTIADDAELVRTPLQVFYDPGYFDFTSRLDNGIVNGSRFEEQAMIGGDLAWHGHRAGPVATEAAPGATRGTLRITSSPDDEHIADRDKDAREQPEGEKRTIVTTDEATGAFGYGRGGGGKGKESWGPAIANAKSLRASWYGAGTLTVARLAYPTDAAFDDVSGWVPALFGDGVDALRAQLRATQGIHAIDGAARTLLADARRRLPSGVYRWGDRELAVDDARRIGWRRTTEAGLAETASFDGTTWTRRYAELGLDVTRPIADDDLALALVNLPIWIADPAHYARYFDVTARGRDVVLSTVVHGRPRIAYVMSFDDQARLVAIADDAGGKLVEVTWNASGPIAARIAGTQVSVGFTGESIADAAAWAHRGTQPGAVVELPGHLVAYWQAAIAKETVGSPAWRHAQRQLIASAAATQNPALAFGAYEALRDNGVVELGDLAIASAGLVQDANDAQFAAWVAPFASAPIAKYLTAARLFERGDKSARLVPQTRDGLVGALWQLRSIVGHFAANESRAGADELVAMGDRALELRLVAAGASMNYQLEPTDVARIWDAVAVGEYKNIAQAQAAQALANRGQFEAAVERIGRLAANYDLDALPARLEAAQYYFNSSRRGPAGWQIAWASWRDRVLAGDSYAHVLALMPAAAQQPADLQRVLARAAALAGTDATKQLAVAHFATAYGQNALAESIVEPLLKTSPSHDLYAFAGNLALGQGRTAEALHDLEAAQDVGADEAVDLNVVRQELGQIITVAGKLALETSGAARTRAVERAMTWGDRWRAIDTGNTAIDQQLGEILLAVGDTAGAWRQLSSTIERDPWSGAGYTTVAESFERQGKVEAALPFWQQAIVIDQTNPTPRLRKAQALIALGRSVEGDVLLHDITSRKWHDVWSGVVAQAQDLIARGKQHP